MSGDAPLNEPVPFPAGGSYLPDGIAPPAAVAPPAHPAPAPGVAAAPSPMPNPPTQNAAIPMMGSQHAASGFASFSPAVLAALEQLRAAESMVPPEPTADELKALLKTAKSVPYQRVIEAADFLIDMANMLVAESITAGNPITYQQAIRTLHRITDMLANSPRAFAEIATLFS